MKENDWIEDIEKGGRSWVWGVASLLLGCGPFAWDIYLKTLPPCDNCGADVPILYFLSFTVLTFIFPIFGWALGLSGLFAKVRLHRILSILGLLLNTAALTYFFH